KKTVQQNADVFEIHTHEKDKTDLEIGVQKALSLEPDTRYIFGVTAGRVDHALINLQLLHIMIHNNILGIIVITGNVEEMAVPGTYNVKKSDLYPYVSFIAYTENVENLTLHGFKYPLHHADISWGSTLCISNELFSDVGEYSF